MPHQQRLLEYGELSSEVWRRLERSAADSASPMHLVVLATVGIDGRPSARLMTLRGVDAASGRLWFHTDARAPKAADARARPYGAVVAYDARDGVQIRISGALSLLTEGPRVQELSEGLATAAHERFEAPGPVSAAADPLSVADPTTLMTRSARRHFAVIELRAQTIDWFQVCAAGRRRAVLHASNHWAAELLNA
jgi:hypothetical protein